MPHINCRALTCDAPTKHAQLASAQNAEGRGSLCSHARTQVQVKGVECDVEMVSARSVGRRHAHRIETKSAPICVLAVFDIVDCLLILMSAQPPVDISTVSWALLIEAVHDRGLTREEEWRRCGWRVCVMLAVRAPTAHLSARGRLRCCTTKLIAYQIAKVIGLTISSAISQVIAKFAIS